MSTQSSLINTITHTVTNMCKSKHLMSRSLFEHTILIQFY